MEVSYSNEHSILSWYGTNYVCKKFYKIVKWKWVTAMNTRAYHDAELITCVKHLKYRKMGVSYSNKHPSLSWCGTNYVRKKFDDRVKWEWVTATNILAYYDVELITCVKSLMIE